jgi:ribosomal protein S18 acetylase RimI-like enzyme
MVGARSAIIVQSTGGGGPFGRAAPRGNVGAGTVRTLEVHSLGFATDLMIRSLAGSEIEEHGDYLVVRTPSNPTFYWGNFVLFAGAVAADEWLSPFAREFPDARHVAIGVDGTDGSLHNGSTLLESGFELEVSTVLSLTRAPTEAARPDALCRRLHTDDDWAQVGDLRVALAEDQERLTDGYRVFLERRIQEAMALDRAGHAVHFGAFVHGHLRSCLGLVTDGRGTARYQQVETHPLHRRRGLAGALVAMAGRHGIAEFAASKLVIVADPQGPAINLYRSLGFRDTEHQVQLTLRA